MSPRPRNFHDFGGAEDTGNRTWDLLHQRADPHQLSYACNFPLVLFLPLVPLGKCCGQGPLTIEGNPLLQKEIPYYRGEITIEREPLTIIGRVMGKSYNKGFLSVARSLTKRGNPLLYSKGFPYIFVWRSRGGISFYSKGFPSMVRDFLELCPY